MWNTFKIKLQKYYSIIGFDKLVNYSEGKKGY